MANTGKAYKFGDDINTDLILPGEYLALSDPKELAEHCMAGADPEFARVAQAGDIIVAGVNFGSGSSREHAPISIKTMGISCVIAKSFARIFYRNAFNLGLAILVAPDAVDEIKTGDVLEVDLESGDIINKTTNVTFHAEPIPEFMRKMVDDGGLIEHIKKNLSADATE